MLQNLLTTSGLSILKHGVISLSDMTVHVHEISNSVVCATSKCSDQPAHTGSLIRAFASRLSIL